MSQMEKTPWDNDLRWYSCPVVVKLQMLWKRYTVKSFRIGWDKPTLEFWMKLAYCLYSCLFHRSRGSTVIRQTVTTVFMYNFCPTNEQKKQFCYHQTSFLDSKWPTNVLRPRLGPGPPVSLKADRTTAQRPHSLDQRAARLHAPRTCLITTAHRWSALINRLCCIVRPHILTAQQMYAFHGRLYTTIVYVSGLKSPKIRCTVDVSVNVGWKS